MIHVEFHSTRLYVGIFLAMAVVFSVLGSGTLVHAQTISAQAGSPTNRFGPGDTIPLSVKLQNFGSTTRVDVTVIYDVTSPLGQNVFHTTETVAVETTASYVKNIVLPANTIPGVYTAKTSVQYPGQTAPAVSEYQFTVERTFFGIYQSEFIWYVAGVVFVVLFFILLVLLLVRYRRSARSTPHDYSMIDAGTRIYYELISDAVQQMRFHEGDRAIKLAQSIPGLIIDGTTGRILRLTSDPAVVMATLVSEYHQRFGRNVNLAFNPSSESRAIVR